jgi:hypothetical protein
MLSTRAHAPGTAVFSTSGTLKQHILLFFLEKVKSFAKIRSAPFSPDAERLTAAQQEVPDLLRWWDELRSRAAFFRTLY